MVTKWQIHKRPQFIHYFPYLFNIQQKKSDESFLTQSYDKLIAMTGKKVACPCSLVTYSHFSTDRGQYQGPPCFQCAPARARANDAINYAQ